MADIKATILANAIKAGLGSQQGLARACGYSEQAMSRRLQCPDRMSLRDLSVMARKTKMPDEDILQIVRMAGGKR